MYAQMEKIYLALLPITNNEKILFFIIVLLLSITHLHMDSQ
jgi:hypothetical protein